MSSAIALLSSGCKHCNDFKAQNLTGLTLLEDDASKNTCLEYKFKTGNALCPNNAPCQLKDVKGLGYPTLICKTSDSNISDVLLGLHSKTDNEAFIARCI
jgi:hypothetical protein